MFTLDPIHPLFTAILQTVSTSPGISIADLHTALRKKKVEVTLQHVYRTVNRLTEHQILLKAGTGVSVNLMWLSYLEFFADRSKQTLFKKTELNIFPMNNGDHKTFKVGSLLDLQTLWNHLLVELHRAAPQKLLLKYYSHAWWQLGKYALDPEFYGRIRQSGLQCKWLIGNTTVLDMYAAELHKKLMDVRLVKEPPFPSEGYCLNIFGSYIFECLFPDRLNRQFETFFHTITRVDQFESIAFSDIFTLPVPLTLKVSRNEKQAAALRPKIERFFA